MALSHELPIYLSTMKIQSLTIEKANVIRACTIIGRQ